MSIYARPFSKRLATLTLSALLVACGGGSDPSNTVDPVDGGNVTGGGGADTGIGGSPLIDGGMLSDSNRACNAGQGTDNDSSDENWDNNCYIQVDPTPADEVSENFSESSYTTGIQRVVWCLGHAADFSMAEFIDSDFGPRTKAAVEKFQIQEGISVDGIVGSETWAAMKSSLAEVGSDSFSVAWAIADPFYTELDTPIFETDCISQPAFWQYLSPIEGMRAWTLTDRDTNDTQDTTTFGRTEEKFFGNTF